MMLVFNMTQITPVSYGTYQYPQWAIAVGWIIGMISVIPIPIYMVVDLWDANGTLLQVIPIVYECILLKLCFRILL